MINPGIHRAVRVILLATQADAIERVGRHIIDVDHLTIAPHAIEQIPGIGVVVRNVAIDMKPAGVIHEQTIRAHTTHFTALTASIAPPLLRDVRPAKGVTEDIAGDEHIAKHMVIGR